MRLTPKSYSTGSLSRIFDWMVVPIMAIVFLLDQATKYWVESTLCPFQSFPAQGSFKFVCTYNTGSAFGMFQDQTIPLIFASFAGIGLLLWLYKTHLVRGPWIHISMGLQLGGAIGNLTDRLRFGQVTDFIQLAFWPVFNLADASIVVGVILLIAVFVLPNKFGVMHRETRSPDKSSNSSVTNEADGPNAAKVLPIATITSSTLNNDQPEPGGHNGN